MAAHQAPASLGFSRQEYWSGFLGLVADFYGLKTEEIPAENGGIRGFVRML